MNTVRGVIYPRDTWTWNATAGKGFMSSVLEWRVSKPVRMATVVGHAPGPVRTSSGQTPLDQRVSVETLIPWLREVSFALPGVADGQTPMIISW